MYLLSFFSSFIIASLTFIKGNVRSVIILLLIITMSLFVGTRNYGVDPDYEVYVNSFSYCTSPQFEALDFVLFEPVTFLIPFIGKLILGNAYFIEFSFFVFALVGISLKIIAFSKYDYFFLSVILYCSYMFFYQEMITIRAGVSCGLFLLAIDDLVYKRDKAYFIKIVVALLFHYSSIIYFIIWILVRLKISIKYFYGLMISSYFIVLLKINLLTLLKLDAVFPKVRIYLDILEVEGGDAVNVFSFRVLIALAIFILFAYKFKLLDKNPSFLVLFKIHILSLCFFFALSTTANVFSLRLYDMLSVGQIILMTYVVQVFKEKWVGYIIILLICIINLYYIFGISGLFSKYSSWLF
ncbi:EpsG family protein [Flavobacterium fluvii]|uniref:EpsG family protein n=1 Tax=Flavobacterium fluvii TaxID=468056 RepID=A0A1M5IN91_9FLAO|nr:EpsG family protein [Flavobacterium fluvii]SHG29798.1 EpsG family protein [Flavobacterium fluvii]